MITCLSLPHASSYDDIAELVVQSPAWDQFLYWCTRHKIKPQLYGALDAEARALLPDKVLKELKGYALQNTGQAMRLSAELARVMNDLAGQGIRVIALKGPALALWAYGDVNLRNAGDLDILVAPDEVDRVDRTLKKAGYHNTTPGDRYRDHLHRLLAKADYQSSSSPPVYIELHSRLMIHPSLLPISFDELYDQSTDIQITGSKIKTLSPEDLLLFLLVHGGEHAWFRVGWLCDIDRILHHHPDLDWSRIADRMARFGLRRILDQSMVLLQDLFGTSVPDPFQLARVPDRQTNYLVKTAVKAMLDEQAFNLDWHTLTPKKILAATWYRLKFQRSLRYKVDVLLKMLVRPQDWDDVPLPRLLFPLYYPLNPVLFLKRRFSRS
jgi:hypothetical protein